MMERAHSLFAPSATKRILACPGSVRMSAGIPDRAGFHAAEGSAAHAAAEAVMLDPGRPCLAPVDLSRVGAQTWVAPDGEEVEFDDEQVEAIETYVRFAEQLRIDAEAEGGWLALEQKVSLDMVWRGLLHREPPGDVYGHLDCAAYFPASRRLVIADYKHGSGHAVEVVDNPQMFVYALGLLTGRLDNHEIDTVSIVVVQPRAPHPDGAVRRFAISVIDLFMWAGETYAPAIELAASALPGQHLSAGEHCRWCPARGSCPELASKALDVARQQFEVVVDPDPLTNRPAPPEPAGLTNAQLGAVLERADMVETWLDGVRQEAAHRLEAGKDVPGWKLVPKRALRRWVDDTSAGLVLEAELGDEGLQPRKHITPAAAERKLGKARFAEVFAGLVSQVSSGTTLAPSADKRAAVVKAAAAQFKELPG